MQMQICAAIKPALGLYLFMLLCGDEHPSRAIQQAEPQHLTLECSSVLTNRRITEEIDAICYYSF